MPKVLTPQPGFEPGFSQSRVRSSTPEPLRSTTLVKGQGSSVKGQGLRIRGQGPKVKGQVANGWRSNVKFKAKVNEKVKVNFKVNGDV